MRMKPRKVHVYCLGIVKIHSDLAGLRWGLKFYTDSKLPGNVDADGPWTHQGSKSPCWSSCTSFDTMLTDLWAAWDSYLFDDKKKKKSKQNYINEN